MIILCGLITVNFRSHVTHSHYIHCSDKITDYSGFKCNWYLLIAPAVWSRAVWNFVVTILKRHRVKQICIHGYEITHRKWVSRNFITTYWNSESCFWPQFSRSCVWEVCESKCDGSSFVLKLAAVLRCQYCDSLQLADCGVRLCCGGKREVTYRADTKRLAGKQEKKAFLRMFQREPDCLGEMRKTSSRTPVLIHSFWESKYFTARLRP